MQTWALLSVRSCESLHAGIYEDVLTMKELNSAQETSFHAVSIERHVDPSGFTPILPRNGAVLDPS